MLVALITSTNRYNLVRFDDGRPPWPLPARGGTQWNTAHDTLYVDRWDFRQTAGGSQWPGIRYHGCRFTINTPYYGIGGLLAHELFRHLFAWQEFGGSPFDSHEDPALFRRENVYHQNTGTEERCDSGGP